MECLLMVDDNPAHRLFAVRALRSAASAIEILEADSVPAGLSLIKKRAAELRIAVIDLKLDHESGIELLKAIRATTEISTTPVIMVSTSDHPQHIEESYRCGANSYIVKGSDPSVFTANLVAAVRYFLRLTA